ncbi:MAG: winged helix-turn-helix transcriptional regulator [Flavobacteriales bacterium]|nr:winged helix-turn-helix transcriptional regulator [Flavobacteriales bacterium]
MENTTCIRVYADVEQINSCKSELDKVGNSIKMLSKALSLAGNEARMKILYLLNSQGKLCVCDLSDILGMSPPAISQHLRKLKDGNVIQNQRVAQTIYYSLDAQYKVLLKDFFEKIGKNEILETA